MAEQITLRQLMTVALPELRGGEAMTATQSERVAKASSALMTFWSEKSSPLAAGMSQRARP
jgi:hypothetical protein